MLSAHNLVTTIISSRGSALTLADNDPVDIAAGSTSTSANAALESAIEIAEGLLYLVIKNSMCCLQTLNCLDLGLLGLPVLVPTDIVDLM